MYCKTIAIITATEIKQMGYFSKYTCLVQSIIDLCILWNACHELFCIFGDFFVSGTRDAGRRGNKITLIHIKDASKILESLILS